VSSLAQPGCQWPGCVNLKQPNYIQAISIQPPSSAHALHVEQLLFDTMSACCGQGPLQQARSILVRRWAAGGCMHETSLQHADRRAHSHHNLLVTHTP
jgi:hypothetical protein